MLNRRHMLGAISAVALMASAGSIWAAIWRSFAPAQAGFTPMPRGRARPARWPI